MQKHLCRTKARRCTCNTPLRHATYFVLSHRPFNHLWRRKMQNWTARICVHFMKAIRHVPNWCGVLSLSGMCGALDLAQGLQEHLRCCCVLSMSIVQSALILAGACNKPRVRSGASGRKFKAWSVTPIPLTTMINFGSSCFAYFSTKHVLL